jgi:hypothetical protein
MSNFWNKRIPTLFAFLLIAVGIGVTSYLTVTGVIPFGNAAPEENPQEVRITNVTDTSFTVTYKTDASIIGSVALGTDPSFGQVALDDRDQATGVPTQHILHSITIRNLKPLTKYFYAITSGRTTYMNRDSPFITITGPKIQSQPSPETPVAGSVQLLNGDKPDEALIYVNTQNGQLLSTLVKSNGIYIIPLNSMRTENLTSYIRFSPRSTLELLALGDSSESHATLFADKRGSVPAITLSNNYDFTLDTAPLTSGSKNPIGFPAFSLDTSIQPEPKIETPVKNQTFTDPQPVLNGKAMPNETVKIEIHSQAVISTSVTADQYGNWSYRPNIPLGAGQHTIVITTKDQNGIVKTIQQAFTIFALGTQVAEAATPSASPTVIITPSPLPSPSPSPTQMPTQTITPTPTITISPTLTATPSPTISLTITPVPSQKIPPTGSNALINIGAATLVTTVAGIVLFLVSSGISL